jgi:hypothetical protein
MRATVLAERVGRPFTNDEFVSQARTQNKISNVQLMQPLDGSSPEDFAGIDYTIFVSAPEIYNAGAVEGKVANAIEAFFEGHAIPVRRCIAGGFGSTTGAPPFWEFVLWVQENWESLEKIASVLAGFAAGVTLRWRRLKQRLNNRILDPYCPSVVIDVAARTKSPSSAPEGTTAQSFYSLLRFLPELDVVLCDELSGHKFSVQVVDLTSPSSPRFALFKVERITTSDVALMIRYLQKLSENSDINAVMLYRAFGLFRRLVPSRGASQFMSLLIRSMGNR